MTEKDSPLMDIVAVLTKVVQQPQEQIETMEERLSALER